VALQAEVHETPKSATGPVDRLAERVGAEMKIVEEMLAERAASPVATIPDLSSYLISAGGKRLRPLASGCLSQDLKAVPCS